jgi:paraquat-inducible protein B
LSESKFPIVAEPEYRAAQRWNIVWVVPIIALLLGGWLIYQSMSSKGPVAHVEFETADGIVAGKTDIRCRSVKVGVVKTVKLTDDMNGVVVTLELEPDSFRLLKSGTHFWVVRPRVSTTDISGLGTLLTGAYIELDPGPPNASPCDNFKGLETPPATNRNIPGLRLVLTAEEAGSLVAGSSIYYHGLEVGRIESRKLDTAGKIVTYDAFIRQEFRSLVKQNTRFWNTSGIDISVDADGLKLRTPSFQAMVSGGASFGVPEGLKAGESVSDGKIFTLFPDEDAAKGSTFNPTMKVLLLFEQSVRGLAKGAPVEFKGIPIGRVADISFSYLQTDNDSRIPVLVEIDPSLLRRDVIHGKVSTDSEFLALAVKKGLRATLKPGSLLTGALFVDVDYVKDAIPSTIDKIGDFDSIPTIPGGLENMLSAALEKFQKLPLEETLNKFGSTADHANSTLAEVRETAASTRKMLDSSEFKKLPSDLRNSLAAFEKLSATFDKSASSYGPQGPVQGDFLRTLEELRAALRALKGVSNTIDDKPNSLLFGRDSTGNPIPRAPSGKH